MGMNNHPIQTAVGEAVQTLFDLNGGVGDAEPVTLRPRFGGKTFDEARDGERLRGHLARVYRVMSDGQWRTLSMICELAKPGSEAGCSARIRDLRKPQFGGYLIESKPSGIDGVWSYRMVK
jgi:hypothetical protein